MVAVPHHRHLAAGFAVALSLGLAVPGSAAPPPPTSPQLVATSTTANDGASSSRLAAKKKLTAPRPTIKGTATVGSRLSVTTGKWGPGKVSLKIQWLRGGKAIKKATKKNYTLTSADAGKKISVKVTGTKKGYAKTSKTSKAVKVERPPFPVAIPDAALRRCVNLELKQTADATITSVQAAKLTFLSCDSRGIVNLAGVQHFTGLLYLGLRFNAITSIAGVSFPAGLTDLDLTENLITSLAGVRLPAGLTSLNFRNNQISSLAGVSFPDEIRTLWLDDNQIKSLAGVKLPAGLSSLWLGQNQISSLAGVKFPVGLTTLELFDNQIVSLVGATFPAGLANLQLTRQKAQLPAVPRNTMVPNPLRDHRNNVVTDITVPLGQDTKVTITPGNLSWSFTDSFSGEAINWSRIINLGGKLPAVEFSGTLSQTAT